MLKLQNFVLSSILLPIFSLNTAIGIADSRTLQSVDGGKMEISSTKARNRSSEETACMEYSGGFVLAKTQKYYIEICGSKTQPLSYYISGNRVGDTKRAEMVLDLQSYTFDLKAPRNNEKFIAVKGDTKYILTRTSVTVKRKNRVIATEKVIYYRRLT